VLATGCVWVGLVLAYAFPKLPPSFTIISVATALYAGTAFSGAWRRAGRLLSARGRVRTPQPYA